MKYNKTFIATSESESEYKMSVFNEEWNRLMPEDLAFFTSSEIEGFLPNLNHELNSNENETTIQDQSSVAELDIPKKIEQKVHVSTNKKSMCHMLDDSKRSTFKKISLNNTLEDCFTFPSLVTVARPGLCKQKYDESVLDNQIEKTLQHTSSNFIQYLMMKGLLRSSQKCPIHQRKNLNFGRFIIHFLIY